MVSNLAYQYATNFVITNVSLCHYLLTLQVCIRVYGYDAFVDYYVLSFSTVLFLF